MYWFRTRNSYSSRINQLMFKNITVIGSGLMGSAIAAHLTNVGCNVNLLDIVTNKKSIPDPSKPLQANSSAPNVDGYYLIDYTSLIPILTKAIQQQQKQIQKQQEQIQKLQEQIQKLQE